MSCQKCRKAVQNDGDALCQDCVVEALKRLDTLWFQVQIHHALRREPS